MLYASKRLAYYAEFVAAPQGLHSLGAELVSIINVCADFRPECKSLCGLAVEKIKRSRCMWRRYM
jgi:hypothetical protein